MPVDPREGLFEFRGFTGLRNNVDERDFGPGDLSVALNVDCDDGLNVTRRKGFSTVVVAGVDRDLFASGAICLGVGSNALKQILPNYSTTTLRSGLTAARPLSYAAVADRVYYANGVELGVASNGTHRTWGLEVPALPLAAATGGDLRAGKYQFAVTFIRNDGQESGAARAGTIALADTGGIALSAISVPTDATIVAKAIYATPVNSETLYRIGAIDVATTTFAIRAVPVNAAPLTTQFLQAPPAGEHIGYANGRMLVAVLNRIYPSEPYAPELFDLRMSVPLNDLITMVAPLEDGTWIGTTSQVIWLANAEPEKWEFKVRAEYGVIPGTKTIADGELIGDGGLKTPAAYFATTNGLCAGTAGGQLINFHQDRFQYPAMDRGAGLVRRHRGTAQFLVSLQGTEVAGNVAS